MSSLTSWHISDNDTGHVVGFSGSKLKIYAEKILPLVKYGKPKSKLLALDKTCLLNDKKCRPKVSSRVRIVNYITVPTDSSISAKLTKYGTKIRLKSKDNNVDSITATRLL